MLYSTAFPISSLRREIDRLFDDAFTGGNDRRTVAWMPVVDVHEDGREFRFDVELAGVSPDDVEVTAENGVLTIRGEKMRRSEKESDEGRTHVVERTYGSFMRSFQLPKGIREEEISASFDHGVLTIRAPKAERLQPRRIRIGSGEERRVTSGDGASATPSAERVDRPRQTERAAGKAAT